MGLLLALDQGGSASRALVVDETGAVLATARRPLATRRQGSDRVEHDPLEVLLSVRAAAEAAVTALGPRRSELSAAALATQRSSIACWDRVSGAPLAPVLSWQDRRAASLLAGLAVHAASVRERTGLPLSPHYGASKLRWCLEELPPVADAAGSGRLACGPLASFLLHRLLLEQPLLADPANASRTLLWDRHTGDWSPALADLFGVPLATLPDCAPTRHAFGTLPVAGLRLPLVVTTGDASAALFAHGPPSRGEAHVTAGTGAFVQRPAGDVPPPVAGLLASVACGDRRRRLHVLEGTVNGAAAALQAVADERGLHEVGPARLQRCLDEAVDTPLFLNGVAGLGSPWWRSDFPSRFVVPPRDDDAALAGVLESIVFLLATNLGEMESTLGRARRVLVGGGLAGLDELCRRLAAVTGTPVLRPAQQEATCLGLATLARTPLDDLLRAAGEAGERAVDHAGERLTAERGAARGSFAESGDGEAGGATGDVFEPVPDAALAARWERWREEMARALR